MRWVTMWPRMRLISLFLVAVSLPAQILLDDFASLRLNAGGTALWAAYTGTLSDGVSGATQTSGVASNQFWDISTTTTPSALYSHFFPNTGSGYPFPSGYAQSFIKSGTWDVNLNRLTWRVYCSANKTRRLDGGSSLEIGTYIRYHTATDNVWQGAHYYHIFDPNLYAGRWAFFTLN